jgi:hypothetical protein
MLTKANSISLMRVDEVLELVGLSHVSRQRAGKFSLGMGQRLGMGQLRIKGRLPADELHRPDSQARSLIDQPLPVPGRHRPMRTRRTRARITTNAP